MSTRHLIVPRLVAVAALAAGMLAFAPSVGAQTCAYNSTQSTCACPTSGAGTSCFGGQLFRSSDNSCQNDVRPCSSNQNWDCASEACVCNTASYPCGGCTAASSTVGATCSTPTNGKYTNVCGACSCPSGTTLCSSSNTCVTTLSCPAGTTFDPCTNSCGTPNVLLSPGWIQSGFIQVNGDMKSTGGNLRMDQATGGGQGDVYIANGKAIRVDGSGVTNLSIGNWGAGGSSVNVFENGNHFAFGLSTIPSDSAVAANTIETGNICLGNGINCRSTWPSTSDFDATYLNVAGDTMTGDLTLSGGTTDLFVGGAVGIGTTSLITADANTWPVKLDVRGGGLALPSGSSISFRNSLNTASYPTMRVSSSDILDIGDINNVFNGIKFYAGGMMRMSLLSNGNFGIGTGAPATALDVNGTAKMTGFQLATGAAAGKVLTSDATGVGTWQTPSGLTGSGTANTIPKFTGATSLGNSRITDDGTTVTIAPGTPSRVAIGLSASAVQDGAIALGLRANASGYYSTAVGQDAVASNSAALAMGGGSAIASGFMSTAIGSYVTASGTMSAVFGSGVSTASPLTNSTGNSLAVGFNSTVPTLYVGPSTGAGTYGNVGIGTSTPAQRLDVNGNANVSGNAASGGYALDVANNGQGGGIDVSSNSSLNGIPTLRVYNSGAGPGLDVTGGTGGFGAQIKGTGDSLPFEAASYNHSGTNTISTVIQVRRGTGSGIAPAAGMGGAIMFPLQSDSAGSYTSGPAFAGVIESTSPWKTALSFIPSTYYGMTEKMRLTNDGFLGIGTSSPTAMLQVNGGSTALGLSSTASGSYSLAAGYGPTASGSYSIALGDRNTATNNTAVAIGAQADATGYYGMALGNYVAATGTGSIAIGGGIDVSRKMTVSGGATIGLGYGSTVPTLVVTSAPNTAGTYGKVGIGTSSPSEMLEVNGNLKFTPANPYISASSYFIAPGGAYFNSGTVYAEAAIQARGGIHNDTGSNLVLQGGTSGVTSTTGPLQVNAGSGGYGTQVNGTAGTWGPSVGVNNGTQEWRAVSWSDNSLKFVKITGSTFTPFTIYNNSYQDELELKSDGISLSGKHAFRSSDSWLRLNQDGAFTSGVHTPGNFAPGALNVGGANGWGNPGGGNAWFAGTATIYGDLVAENNSWGSGNGWIYCGANTSCWCPGGMFVIAELNYNYYYGYSYIYCAKP